MELGSEKAQEGQYQLSSFENNTFWFPILIELSYHVLTFTSSEMIRGTDPLRSIPITAF